MENRWTLTEDGRILSEEKNPNPYRGLKFQNINAAIHYRDHIMYTEDEPAWEIAPDPEEVFNSRLEELETRLSYVNARIKRTNEVFEEFPGYEKGYYESPEWKERLLPLKLRHKEVVHWLTFRAIDYGERIQDELIALTGLEGAGNMASFYLRLNPEKDYDDPFTLTPTIRQNIREYQICHKNGMDEIQALRKSYREVHKELSETQVYWLRMTVRTFLKMDREREKILKSLQIMNDVKLLKESPYNFKRVLPEELSFQDLAMRDGVFNILMFYEGIPYRVADFDKTSKRNALLSTNGRVNIESTLLLKDLSIVGKLPESFPVLDGSFSPIAYQKEPHKRN